MSIKKFTAVLLTAATVFSAQLSFAAPTGEEHTENSGEYTAFEQIAKYVSERYIDDSYTKEEIMQRGLSSFLENNDKALVELLKSTLSSMDNYSEFYTAEEYREYQDALNHTFYGIGIKMKQTDKDYVEIDGFTNDNSEAEKAGMKIGDKICAVDGEDVKGLPLDKVRERIIGKEGTTVSITVIRADREINFTVKRMAVKSATVGTSLLEGGIGYIQIISFSADTAKEFSEALDLMRENEVTKIILDLRNNGGGLVSAAVSIAEMIVPRGKIIDVKYRDSKYNTTYNSRLDKKEFDFAVLVNANTASSSEILASAVQDSQAGILIGEPTYGKAVIQNPYPLTNGMVFKLTVGQYITRNGKEINNIGLVPDKAVENTAEKIDDSEYTKFDFQTRAAFGYSHSNAKAAKERLYMLGFYTGSVESDVFDEALKTAVKDFQKANNLLSYGVLDIPTQKRINEEFLNLETVVDDQFSAAMEYFGGSIE